MNLKLRLIVLNFLEFFVWGSYLTSLGGYLFVTQHFKPTEIGAVYTTMGIASLFMPTILGIIADKYMNAERVLGLCHFAGAVALYFASVTNNPGSMFWVMLAVSCTYMPTIALNNTVGYNALIKNGLSPQKDFPPIRFWGTVGFIAAMWSVDLLGWTLSHNQLVFAAGASVVMGLYSFTVPQCPPANTNTATSFSSKLGLDAFVLFKNNRMLVFFIFSMFLGAALQITNQWGVTFVEHFGNVEEYKNTFGVKHSNILISISQVSETLFILSIPFFLKRFGIKTVMLISIIAWVLRFGLFAIGNPGSGVWLLVLSMIVYGMAFDFFNISGALFVEKETDKKIRASAQGLFMLLTNGLGAIMGSYGSGWIVQAYTDNGITNWPPVWLIFSVYALVLAVTFQFSFKYKHNPNEFDAISH